MTTKTKVAVLASTLVLGALVLWKSEILVSKPPVAREVLSEQTIREAEELREAAKSQAQQMLNAMFDGDLEKMADLTLGESGDRIGGREELIKLYKTEFEQYQRVGAKFSRPRLKGSMTITNRDGVHHARGAYEVDVTTKDLKTFAAESSIDGESRDGGKSWKFSPLTRNWLMRVANP
jgi:hypothetical protein